METIFIVSFPTLLRTKALELHTIIVCVKLWGKYWKGQIIVIAYDNKVTVDVINAGRARDAGRARQILGVKGRPLLCFVFILT